MIFKRFSAMIMSAVLTVGSLGAVNVMAQEKAKIFIAGDSTACIYGSDDNYAVAREGWGMALSYMVKEDKAEVVDLALSGRSSKSFLLEDNYKTLMNDMQSGDYLIIQFGHNDEKADKPEESNDPTRIRHTTLEDTNTEGSFKNYLNKYYIEPAKAKGVTPILLTPVSRHEFDENGKCTDSHGEYDDAIRDLAKEVNVSCVDMTKLTSDLYDKEGKAQTQAYHAIFKSVEKGVYGHDDTHFNRFGALTVAELARTELLKLDGIKDVLRPSKTYTNNYTNRYTITRADFACVMARTLGADPVKDADKVFNDTDKTTNPDNIAYIQAAKDLGIIEGDEKGNFHPSTQLKFEDMVVMIVRTIKKAGLNPQNYGEVNIPHTKEYAKDSMNIFNYYFKNEMVGNIKADSNVDMISAFSMYVNVYDLIVQESENHEIKVQSAADIEKVE